MNTLGRIGSIALVISPIACQELESSDVRTSGVGPVYTVSADEADTTQVRATLHAGPPTSLTYLELTSGDTLSASVSDVEQELEKAGAIDFNAPTYVASFADADAIGAEMTIAFTRADDDSAPSSTVVVPEDVAITAPAADATLLRASGFTVTLDRAPADDEEGKVLLDGDCIDSLELPLNGAELVVDANEVTKREPAPDAGPVDDSCAGRVRVQLTREGTLDPVFEEGGSITAQQERTTSVTFSP